MTTETTPPKPSPELSSAHPATPPADVPPLSSNPATPPTGVPPASSNFETPSAYVPPPSANPASPPTGVPPPSANPVTPPADVPTPSANPATSPAVAPPPSATPATPRTGVPPPSATLATPRTGVPPPSANPATPRTGVPPPSANLATPPADIPPPSANLATPPADVPPPSAVTSTPTPTPSAAAATPATVTPRLPEPDSDVIHIPSYSQWFSWNGIHECESRFVPEFFDGRTSSKNPRVYKYYRNAIIRRFREHPSRKITFTEVRKTIVGDVGSIRRVFDFLEAWGLINYAGSTKPQLKWEDKETKSAAATSAQGGDATAAAAAAGPDSLVAKKRVCSGCKAPCTYACFASDKHDMTLCARCYVRGNYRVGLSSADFKRVEVSEEPKTDWTDRETLQLLEGIMHYGDDWKKVAEHVGGRSVKECVGRFIKLPFGEQFDGPPGSAELDAELGLQNVAMPTKKMRLSPLADASNPIMAQTAFLSTFVGVDVAEVAARAAITALSDFGDGKPQESNNAFNGNKSNLVEEAAVVEAKSQLEKEEEELEKAVSGIATQSKEIEEKIVQFDEFDLEMERKRHEFQQLQSHLFVDQLTLLFHKTDVPKTGGNTGPGHGHGHRSWILVCRWSLGSSGFVCVVGTSDIQVGLVIFRIMSVWT